MLDFITESFDLEKTNEYILSIQISLDGFSFSIVDPQENKIIAFKYTSLKISNQNLISPHFDEWIQKEDLLQKNYLKIVLIYFTGEFTLIPENLFNSQLVKEATTRLISENSGKETIINTVNGLDTAARIVFYLPQNLKIMISRNFSSLELLHPVQLITKQIPHGK